MKEQFSRILNEEYGVIHGRPDFGDRTFGITLAKKFPPYVFSILSASALVHKIARVELRWYEVGGRGEKLVRLNRPRATAITNCSQVFYLKGERSRTCHVPKPDAVLCGRCHGEPATFGPDGAATKSGLHWREAHVKLGCVVNGY